MVRRGNGKIEVGQVGQARDAVAPDHIRGFPVPNGSKPIQVVLQRICMRSEPINQAVTEYAPVLQ